jgi:hypothetical protein
MVVRGEGRPGFRQPSFRFLCLNPLRLEAGDSRLQTRVPELGVKGLSSINRFHDDVNPPPA